MSDISYSISKAGRDRWKIYQHIKGMGQRLVCEMTTEDIMKLYEGAVPDYKEEVFVVGDPNCKHQWKAYALNDKFKLCHNCDAILKIIRLVPRRYDG
jgi:hypothetical protein